MAVAMGFSSSIVGQSILSERTSKHTPMSRSHQLQQAEIKMAPQLTYMKKAMKRKSLKLFVVPPSSSIFDTHSLSPAQTIMQFYSAINEKNLKQLDKLIAEDCFFEDYSFPKPFQGKKEVLHFLEQLTMCMGHDQNMQFNVGHICEGNDYTAAVNWHLEQHIIRKYADLEENFNLRLQIGKRYRSLSPEDAAITHYQKAQVLVESPIKLGAVALTIFKIVSSLFDAYPAATEWFLKSPHIMFRLLLKTYNIVIQPIISPVLAWYIKLLNFAVGILSFTLKILRFFRCN